MKPSATSSDKTVFAKHVFFMCLLVCHICIKSMFSKKKARGNISCLYLFISINCDKKFLLTDDVKIY